VAIKNQKPKTKNKKLKKDKSKALNGQARLPTLERSDCGQVKARKVKKVKLPKSSKASKDIKVSKSLKSPKTMDELMALYGGKIRGFKRGEEITARVTAIGGKKIYFDIGGKTEGVVLGREFEYCRDFIKTLRVGSELKVKVGNPENDRGQILLNLRQASQGLAWNSFEENLKSQEEIEVQGRELNKGGLVVSAPFGLQGFVPSSQLGMAWHDKQESLINRVLKVKVIEVDRENNRLVFSERLVSEAEKITQEKLVLKKIKPGKTYNGEITQVLPYGLTVKIKAKELTIEGLVHISEISWKKVDDLNGIYKAGDKIKVEALKIDGPKLQLSVKRLLADPWTDLEKKYPTDSSIEGLVRRLAAYGALIELEPGVEGLLHISKIPPDYKIDVGGKVACFVESVDKKNRKISLGLVLQKKPIGYK